jgi:hypothetical protein
VRIAVEDDGVRFNVCMNILFADQVVNSPRERRDDITPAECGAMRGAIAEYFGGARSGAVSALVDLPNRVCIDGVEVAPVIRTLEIVRPELDTRPGFEQSPALLLPQIFVVAEYPCKSAPRSVSMVWGAYPRDFIAADRDTAPISDVEAVVTGRGALELVTFRKSEPEYVWHAPAAGAAVAPVVSLPAPGRVSIPAASLVVVAAGVGWVVTRGRRGKVARMVLAGAATVVGAAAAGPYWRIDVGASAGRPISEAEAVEVFTALRANVYRAFDYTRESDIYDALARSVDGPLLDSIYNDVYRGLVMQEEGGALSRVRAVTPLETTRIEEDAGDPRVFAVRSRWRVEGVVYHWGHSHTRTNEYLAEYRLACRAEGWRIVGLRPLEQRRIETDAQAQSAASVSGSGAPGARADLGAQRPEPGSTATRPGGPQNQWRPSK